MNIYAPSDLRDDGDDTELQEYVDVISALAPVCQALKTLKVSRILESSFPDLHLLCRITPACLEALEITGVTVSELETIFSWPLPNLRELAVNLRLQTSWKTPRKQTLNGSSAGCANLEVVIITLDGRQRDLGLSTFEFVTWLCDLLPAKCQVILMEKRRYNSETDRRWTKDMEDWYRKVRQLEQQPGSL